LREALAVTDLEHGLSDSLVQSQRDIYGWNETVEKKTPLAIVFLLKFWGATPVMIEIAMGIAFGLGENINGGVIAALLFINGVISFNEDVRARKALGELVKKLQVVARAKRSFTQIAYACAHNHAS